MAPKKTTGKADTSSPSTRNTARLAARATRSSTASGEAMLHTPVENPEPRKRKRTANPDPDPAPTPSPASSSASGAVRTIVIEHCKQTSSFKTKANQVSKALKKAIRRVKVLLNPAEPRKGCFEVREEGGDIFVSLLDLEAPFQALKDLDVGKLVSDIVEKLE